ncbi:MAG: Gfo/Idh/MocA family oxidoreductase [Verrucomicrobiales bacterium]|nr:Gfo/Idh/MocA family oxidoreductase [Verrucomicrobiales bacterium]
MHTPPVTTRPMARRDFLRTTTVGAALLTAAPASLRGAPGANERLAIGCIGVGGRGTDLLNQILSLAAARNVQVTAVCDVWQKNLAAATQRVASQSGQTPRQYTRFHELLGRPDIDAVTIATPDFSHGPILLAALRAGKDVYIEKPMTIDLASANEALDLARAGERVVQVGTQRRSEGRFRGAAKLVASGVLGPLSRVSAAMYFHEPRWARDVSDCHAPDVDWDAFLLHLLPRAFDARLLRQWQLFRDTSNGLPGLWMTHYADAVHLVTGARYPTSAVAHGGVYVWKDGRDTTDTFHALLEYPEGFLFDWGMGLGNSAGVHFTLHGTLGTLDLERWRLSPEGGRNTTLQAGPVPAEPDQSHMDNWLACLRTRERPNADIQFGHQHTVATVMAARALESGQRQRYDPAQRTLTPG